MSIINTLKKTNNFLSKYSLLVLYRVYVLPILDYDDIILITVRLLNLISLKAFKLLQLNLSLVGVRTTSHEIILKELGLTPVFVRHQFHILKTFMPSFLDHVHRSYPPLLQSFLKIFPTTLHVSIRTFSYPPVKHIPYIIIFSIKAQNSGIIYPLTFIIWAQANSAPKCQIYSLPKKLMLGICTVAILTQLLSCVCFV